MTGRWNDARIQTLEPCVQIAWENWRVRCIFLHFCSDGGNDWNCLLHNCFCKSVHHLRRSLRFMGRIQWMSHKNWDTRIGRANLVHCSRQQTLLIATPTLSIEIPAQEIFYRSTKNEWERFHNQIDWQRFVLILTILRAKAHWRVLKI